MGIFGITQQTPLHCTFSQETYDGGNLNPSLKAMTFFNCNNAQERLRLMDEILISDWYQARQGTLTLSEIKEEFYISPGLENAQLESEKLLTSGGLFNVQGLHGGSRRAVHKSISYNNDCPMCHEGIVRLSESTFLNAQLKFGRIDLTRWEFFQLKFEGIADFAYPLVESFDILKNAILRPGQRHLSNLSSFLHAIDFYIDKFRKQIETILVLSLGMKAMCLGYEKLGVKAFKNMHERLSSQVNSLLILGSVLFVWKGCLTVVDKDLGETLFIGILLFFIYLIGFKGLVKIVAGMCVIGFVDQAMRARSELNNLGRQDDN